MNCPNCNNKVTSGTRFCAGCGSELSGVNTNSKLDKSNNKFNIKIMIGLIIAVGVLFIGISNMNKSVKLYPFVKTDSDGYYDEYGYMNEKGEIVIEANYEFGLPFYEGVALVVYEGEACFINKKGEVEITMEGYYMPDDIIGSNDIDYLGRFENGLFPVGIDGKYGYIDKKGKLVISNKFLEVSNFSDGLATVNLDGKYGVINTKGEFVIKPQYDYALAPGDGLIPVYVDEEWGYVNTKGKIVIKPQFEEVDIFSEDVASVYVDGKWGSIDTKGNFVIEPQFEEAYRYSDGLAAVYDYDEYEYGYIDKKGNFVIEPQFDYVQNFNEGIALVETSDYEVICIDKSGKRIIPIKK